MQNRAVLKKMYNSTAILLLLIIISSHFFENSPLRHERVYLFFKADTSFQN